MTTKNKIVNVQLIKVENGYVIATNVKSLVAKTEEELAELMIAHFPELVEFLNKPEEQPNGTDDQPRIVVPRGVVAKQPLV